MRPCLLLVIEDGPATLAAARFAVGLARPLGARIKAIGVIADSAVCTAVGAASGRTEVADRRSPAALSMLEHVARLARLEEVEIETIQLHGDTAECVLAEAGRTRPDFIVLGREEVRRPAGTGIADWTGRILEFAEQPVIAVPGDWKTAAARTATPKVNLSRR